MSNKFTRLEKKWVFKNKDKETLTQNLISHNLYFRPHFQERFVNSIYFDNLDLKFAEDNLAGVSNRKKIRLRWYSPNSNTLINPTLEVKVKKNFQGFKKLFAFKEFNNFKVNEKNLKKISEKINNTLVSENLIPITQVFYKRNYLPH